MTAAKKPAAKKPVAKKPVAKKPVAKKVAQPLPPPEVVEASGDDPRILYTIRLETSLVNKLHTIAETSKEKTTHAALARGFLRDALMRI